MPDHSPARPGTPPGPPRLTGHAHLADEVHVLLLVLLRHQHVGPVGLQVSHLAHPELLHLGGTRGAGVRAGGGATGDRAGAWGHPQGHPWDTGDTPRDTPGTPQGHPGHTRDPPQDLGTPQGHLRVALGTWGHAQRHPWDTLETLPRTWGHPWDTRDTSGILPRSQSHPRDLGTTPGMTVGCRGRPQSRGDTPQDTGDIPGTPPRT